jgi:hypothetical protein
MQQSSFNYRQVSDQREVLSENRTYYVSNAGTNNSNGRSPTNAFQTIQKAVDVATGTLDAGTYQVTIQLLDGTYTEAVILYPMLGILPLIIRGNPTTVANTHVSVTGFAFTSSIASAYTQLKDMKITGSTIGVSCQMNSQIGISNINFGASSSRHLDARYGGIIQIQGDYSITGAAASHFYSQYGGLIRSLSTSPTTITITGTPAFSTAFALSDSGGLMQAFALTFSGGTTGQRYNSSQNSIINTGGGGANYFPGNSAGATATGGLYI